MCLGRRAADLRRLGFGRYAGPSCRRRAHGIRTVARAVPCARAPCASGFPRRVGRRAAFF